MTVLLTNYLHARTTFTSLLAATGTWKMQCAHRVPFHSVPHCTLSLLGVRYCDDDLTQPCTDSPHSNHYALVLSLKA